MSKEQERLLGMLKRNKISESDYHMLHNALCKQSIFKGIENSLLINPFQKIAGLKALIWGLILMLVMSAVGTYAQVYYDGILGYILPLGLKTTVLPNFFLLLYQNLVACVTLSLLFLVTALAYQQKGIRYIDFFGIVFLSRYPTLISLLFMMLHKLLEPQIFTQDISQGFEMHLTLINSVSNLIFLACFAWQIMTYFFALRESSGLEGKKLWFGFLITMLIGDCFAMILTRIFLYN